MMERKEQLYIQRMKIFNENKLYFVLVEITNILLFLRIFLWKNQLKIKQIF